MKEGVRNFSIAGVFAAAFVFYAFIWDPVGAAFNRKTADALMLHKTRTQIIQMLGPPTFKDSVEPESAYTYQSQSGGKYIRIYFDDRGVSDRTNRWTN